MGYILLIILALTILFWPYISRWLQMRIQRKAEDYMRQAMGMPPRDKKRRSTGGHRAYGSDAYAGGRNGRDAYGSNRHNKIIPPEYGEDVEYVEVKEYSSTRTETITTDADGNTHHRVRVEEQVSDAEWVEIKN